MTQNELRRFLAKYKPKTLYTQKTDAIKNNKPIVVNPVKYKPKANETVINLPGQKPRIVRRRNEVVSTDNKSNAQRRLDLKKDEQTRQYYQLLKNSLAFEEGVNAMTKLISPSTYVGAAARSLTGDGTFGSNLTSGTGFNDPIANIAFDVATPIALKSLQNPIPINKVPHTGKLFFNSLPYKTIYNTLDAIHKVGNFMRSNPFNMRSYFFNNMLKEARRNPLFMLKNIKPLHQYKTYIKGATDLTKLRYLYAYKNNRELFGQYDKLYGGFVIGETPVETNLNNITTMDYIPYRLIKKLTDSKNPFVNIPAYFKANMEPAFSMDNLIKINKKALHDLGFDKDITYSHELNHSLTPTYITTYAPNGMSFSHLKKGTRNYLTHDNFTELKARGTLLKNYFGITDGQPITGDMLKYAAKNYVKDLGFDNNMTQMFSSIKDWDAAAKWFTDYGL